MWIIRGELGHQGEYRVFGKSGCLTVAALLGFSSLGPFKYYAMGHGGKGVCQNKILYNMKLYYPNLTKPYLTLPYHTVH